MNRTTPAFQPSQVNPFSGLNAATASFKPTVQSSEFHYEDYQGVPAAKATYEELPTIEQYEKQKFHVTNLCKFFIDGGCTNDNCTFAHSREEMNAFSSQTNPFWKTRKCRAFHNEKTCMYGIACLYKHEIQGCKRKRRHFYIPTLSTASFVYHEEQEDDNMDDTCLTGARRLPIFESIHAMDIETEPANTIDSDEDDFDDCIKGQESSDDAANAETDLDSN